jgi:putative ABC transport system permease protein
MKAMWKNYLTVGLRTLGKNRTYAFINIFGLTVGLAVCLLLLLFVRHHMRYDAWLPNAERTFQLQSERVATEEPPTFTQRTFYPAAAAIEKDFPQIENVAAAWDTRGIILEGGQPAYADMLMADPDFFDLIQVQFVRGSRASALRDADALVLTESEARKRFGSGDPLGRTLSVVRRGVPAELRVTGVIKDLPGNTHLALPMVTRLSPALFADDPMALERWNSIPAYVYVRLRPGADAAAINAALPAWEKRTIPVDTIGSGQMSRADRWALHLENVRDVHLGAFQESAMTPGSDRTTIATFAVVALLILGIACVNFTNLATARASRRAREVALRKVLGARRRQLIAQFLGESVVISGFALVVALAIVEISLPAFSQLLGTRLELHYLGAEGALLPMAALALLVGIAGGLYPAFYLSSFRPSSVLRANQQGGQGSSRLRNFLVLAQFAVSIALIICTAVVYLQTVHLRTADTGYEREGLLIVKNLSRKQVEPSAETLLQQVARLPGVLAVGRSDITPAGDERTTVSVQLPGRTDLVMIGSYFVDSGFFRTMGIRTIAGRSFSERFANDDSTLAFSDEPPAGAASNAVVNASGARQLGFSSPAAAIGAQLKIGEVPTTIVGVVPDVQYRSLREEMEPILYSMTRTGHSSLIVRYSSSEASGIAERVGQVWRRQVPDVPFESFFVEDAVAQLYEADEARSYAFAASAALAIVVGCLGLYALAAFSAERRVKEIGIRKVLGARTKDIVQLLVWQFSKPVVLANLIAWPVAWWVMRSWLNGFQDRISLNPALFLLAGLAAFAIAVVTVVGHAVKVARAHPIHALRYE